MSFSEPPANFMPYPNGIDAMGFWPQFPGPNEQPETNGQYDHAPPFKRSKNSDDNESNGHRTPPSNPPVNQPLGRIFFKTRLCAKFRMGQCRNGENCNFAHGEEDLRQPPPNWQDLVSGRTEDRGGNGNWEEDDRIIHRMKLCKKFYNGEECPYGERCNFLHKEPVRLRDSPARFRDSSSRECAAISIGTTGPPMVQQVSGPDQYEVSKMQNGSVDLSRGNSRPMYWKTKLCTKFEITGHCPFGVSCHFAHGQAELLLPGGRPVEGEPVALSSVPLKSVPPPTNEPILIKTEAGVPPGQDGHGKKCLLKWKGTRKINCIYGDWIDDFPLNLPHEVES